MEYPTLRRPKRKLCYLTNKESPSKQWAGKLTLGDVDRMFDDLDSSPHDDDLLTSSPLLQTSDTERNQSEREAPPVPQEGHLTKTFPTCEMGPEGDVLPPATGSLSPKVDIDLDIPLKVHKPVKTSSPIEKDVVVEGEEEEDKGRNRAVSPILFDCEDEDKEEANTEPLTIKEPRVNGHATDDEDSELESPPSKFAISKPLMSSHKNKVEGSCKGNLPVKEKTHKKPQTPVLETKRKVPRQESTDSPVSAERQKPEPAALEKLSSVHSQPAAEMSTRVGKDMTTFLQKLRDAGQSKPACSRKSLSPVKVPTLPPEPEDDFLILEDEAPLWFSIPSKSSKKQKPSRTSSSDKDSSTDKGTKDSALETAQKEDELEKANARLENQPVNQKMKKKKGREKKNEAVGPKDDEGEYFSPEDLPAGDLMEQEKPIKKKQQQLKKTSLKENDKAKEKPKDTASRESDEENPSQKMKKKAQKSSVMKSSKSSKDGKENVQTSRAKSLKETRKAMQESENRKEMVYDEAVMEQDQEQNSKKPADVEHLRPLVDQKILNSDAQTAKDLEDGKAKQNKLATESEGSLCEERQILGKRKRKQTGQWWLNCPQSTEETKVTDNQPTLKKSKQHSKEPSATESSAKAKKDRILKKRNQKRPAELSSQNTINATENKAKRNKNRPAKEDTPDKMKATDEVFNTTETEQQQQEVPNQDLDPVQLSPLVFTHRDLSLNSGRQVFQNVYHHVSNQKMSNTPAAASPRRPQEELRPAEPEKRKRKPPGNWWTLNNMPEDVEDISSQPQQLNPKQPKSRKERKKKSKQSKSPGLGTPKNGNVAVSSKPLGGAHVTPVKLKPLSAPKTVKRSLATFKDIFTSATETPSVVSSRNAGQNNRRNVAACPAVEVTVTDCAAVCTDAGEFKSTQNSPPNHDTAQDSNCQPENTLKDLKSGPSSMIELEQYEEKNDSVLLSPRVHAELSFSDLCAPPLKPLILQPKDKANLTEWFKSLWSTVDNGAEITPDQFDWYFYQGRAIGFLVDLNCGSICNGKILLGSYMKKPLWVDHSAITVFNLLTSSVSVTIDGKQSRFNPGQSFMVQCGHAYSIQNVTAQPAVLYFTRILAESSG